MEGETSGGAERGRAPRKREHGSDGADHVTYFLDTWSEVRDGQLVRYLVHGDRRVARLASATGQTQAALAADTEGTKAEEPPAAHAARLRVLSMNAGWFFVSLALIAALGARYRRQLEVALPAVIAALALSLGACGHGGGTPPPPDVPDGTILTLSEDDEILLDDVVGSVNEQVSGSGKVKGSCAVYPGGLARYDSVSTERKFANTPRDVGVGLDMMGARAYAADIGAWTRPDPLRIERPETLVGRTLSAANAYLYANADPISRNDPSGYDAEAILVVGSAPIAITIGITIGIGVLTYAAVHNSSSSTDSSVGTVAHAGMYDLATAAGTFAKKKGEASEGGGEKPKKEARPKFRAKTVEQAVSEAEDGPIIGTKKCPTCGKTIDDSKDKHGRRQWDLDHKDKKWSDTLKDLKAKGATKKEANDEYQKGVRLQCRACNIGHQFEPKPNPLGTGGYLGAPPTTP